MVTLLTTRGHSNLSIVILAW